MKAIKSKTEKRIQKVPQRICCCLLNALMRNLALLTIIILSKIQQKNPMISSGFFKVKTYRKYAVVTTNYYLKSKRSASITLFQAEIKSLTNLLLLSFCAYTSTMARSSEFDPKTKSVREAVRTTSPVVLSFPV